MKPLVYFDFKEATSSNSVIINKDKLKQIIDEVYSAGYEDGFKASKPRLTGSSLNDNAIPKGYVYKNGSNSIEAVQTVL